MMIPVTTTMVITKPGPDQIFGDKPVVTMGVNGKIYKFVLNDAYVDDPRRASIGPTSGRRSANTGPTSTWPASTKIPSPKCSPARR